VAVEQCTEIEKLSGLVGRRSVRFHQEKRSATITPPLVRVRSIFRCYSGGDPHSLLRDRRLDDLATGGAKRSQLFIRARRNASRRRDMRQKCCFITHHGGRTDVYLLARGSNYSVTSIGAAWAARCDDSLGAAVLLEVSPVRVLPKRGKCVGLAGF
jgi:hypothetical protein